MKMCYDLVRGRLDGGEVWCDVRRKVVVERV